MSGPFVDRKALSARAARYIALFDGVTGEDFAADSTVDVLRADQRQLVEIMKDAGDGSLRAHLRRAHLGA